MSCGGGNQNQGNCCPKPCCPPPCGLPGVTCPTIVIQQDSNCCQPCCPAPCCPPPQCCPPQNNNNNGANGGGNGGCGGKRNRREKRYPQCNFLKPCIDSRIYRNGEAMCISYTGHVPGEQFISGRNLPTTTTFAKKRLCSYTPYDFVDPDGCCSFCTYNPDCAC